MDINAKTYFKVMSIVMLVMGIVWCCTLIGIIFGIPLIIGSNAMKKALYSDLQTLKANNTTLLVWGIVFGIFTSPIGIVAIVFAVIVYNMIENGAINSNFTFKFEENKSKSSQTKESDADIEDKRRQVEDLKRMLDNGLITLDEFERRRKEILGL